jgi:hypothetical protein
LSETALEAEVTTPSAVVRAPSVMWWRLICIAVARVAIVVMLPSPSLGALL